MLRIRLVPVEVSRTALTSTPDFVRPCSISFTLLSVTRWLMSCAVGAHNDDHRKAPLDGPQVAIEDLLHRPDERVAAERMKLISPMASLDFQIVARRLHADVHLAAGRHEHQLVIWRQGVDELLKPAADLRQRLERRLAVVDQDRDPHRDRRACAPSCAAAAAGATQANANAMTAEIDLSHRAENGSPRRVRQACQVATSDRASGTR